jgi:hypothetical protein
MMIVVEALIEHIKDVFKIDPLPIRGYQKATGITLLSVLLYQIIVYYNCVCFNFMHEQARTNWVVLFQLFQSN